MNCWLATVWHCLIPTPLLYSSCAAPVCRYEIFKRAVSKMILLSCVLHSFLQLSERGHTFGIQADPLSLPFVSVPFLDDERFLNPLITTISLSIFLGCFSSIPWTPYSSFPTGNSKLQRDAANALQALHVWPNPVANGHSTYRSCTSIMLFQLYRWWRNDQMIFAQMPLCNILDMGIHWRQTILDWIVTLKGAAEEVWSSGRCAYSGESESNMLE